MALNVILALVLAALLLWRAAPLSLRDVCYLVLAILIVCAASVLRGASLPTPAATAAGDTRSHRARSAIPARRGPNTYPLVGSFGYEARWPHGRESVTPVSEVIRPAAGRGRISQ